MIRSLAVAIVLTIDPTIIGFEFVAGTRDDKRTLAVRDARHAYVLTESL